MGFVFNKVRHLLFGGVCLGGIVLMQQGCASIVFDELSDMRQGAGGSVSSSGAVVFGAKYGRGNDQFVQEAAIDAQGRVVMAGMTLGNTMQDVGCSVASKGGLDMFVTWVDPNKLEVTCPISRLLGSLDSDVPLGIAANPKLGGVGIVGFSTGDFDCGNGSLTNHGGRDVVVAEFVGDTCSWQQSFGGLDDQEGRAIAFDSDGAAYIGGRFKGTVEFEEPDDSVAIGFDAFIAKLTFGTGAPSSSMRAGGAGDQEVHRIAVHSKNTLIVGGRFSESLDFKCTEPLSIQDSGHDALFVASLNPSTKTCTWQKRIAQGPQEDSPISLAVANDGDIFVAGGFRSRTLFPEPSPDQSKCKQDNLTQSEDVFVAKLNINGECQWSRRFGDVNSTFAEHQRAYAIAVDAASNVYVTGQFHGSIAFDATHQYQSLGDTDGFVLKLNSAGEYVWSHVIAGTGSESGLAVVLDASGEFVFVAGSFKDSSLKLAGESLTPTGLDVFLAKITR